MEDKEIGLSCDEILAVGDVDDSLVGGIGLRGNQSWAVAIGQHVVMEWVDAQLAAIHPFREGLFLLYGISFWIFSMSKKLWTNVWNWSLSDISNL